MGVRLKGNNYKLRSSCSKTSADFTVKCCPLVGGGVIASDTCNQRGNTCCPTRAYIHNREAELSHHLSHTHTHRFSRRRLQPQIPFPALFAFAFAPDHLRARLAQEGLFVDHAAREGPLHSFRGGERVHRPPVEGPTVPLELEPAAGAVFVLRPPHSPGTSAMDRLSSQLRVFSLLGVYSGLCLHFIPNRAVYLCTHSGFWKLHLQGLRGLHQDALHGLSRRIGGRARQVCVCSVGIVVLVRFS